jgi:hypothetical protein
MFATTTESFIAVEEQGLNVAAGERVPEFRRAHAVQVPPDCDQKPVWLGLRTTSWRMRLMEGGMLLLRELRFPVRRERR